MKSIYIPFQISNGSVRTTTLTERIIEQKILDVLTTSKYERVMNSQYGSDVYGLLFDIMDEAVMAEFKVEAMLDLQEHVDGAQIVDIQFRSGNSSGEWDYNTSLGITVTYRIPPNTMKGVTFTVSQ